MNIFQKKLSIAFWTLFLVSVFTVSASAAGNTYYVSLSGDDTNYNGLSVSAAFATIKHAAAVAGPGDTIIVQDGTYYEDEISISGKAGSNTNRFVLKAANPRGVKIISLNDFNAINIINSIGVTIEGLDVTFSDTVAYPYFGIYAGNSSRVTIKNNAVYNAGSSGIQLNTSDNLLVEGNVVRDNARTGPKNGSGISIFHPVHFETYTDDYHIIIRNNISYNNATENDAASPTDGNGIIMDDFQNGQGGGEAGGYSYQSLVENNLSFHNGGRGVHVYYSNNVTVRNNTLWKNNFVLHKYYSYLGDMSVEHGSGNTIEGNFIFERPENTQGHALWDKDTGVNTYLNNRIVGDPAFLNTTNSLTTNGSTGNTTVSSMTASAQTSGASSLTLADDLSVRGNPGYAASTVVNFTFQAGSDTHTHSTLFGLLPQSKDAYTNMSASKANFWGGGITWNSYGLTNTKQDSWAALYSVDFGDSSSQGLRWKANLGVTDTYAGGTIEVRKDNKAGPLLGVLNIGSTGAFGTAQDQFAILDPITGVHDIYLIFKGSTITTCNLYNMQFNRSLVTNGSFASGVTSWNKAASTYTIAQETSVTRSGGKSAKVSGRTAYWHRIQQQVPMVAGKTYQIKAWVKTDILTGGNDQFYIQGIFTPSGQPSQYVNMVVQNVTTTGWIQLTGTYSVTESGTAMIAIYNSGTADFYVDDVSVVEQ
ncbi:carbohydrate-binding protein [Paenibacillus roseipurpureus]|uniref:Right-handed parallel beta-helix repeat-containing protein n=1 Tax=Paenibacillus roseopurpureus TaxID=2918901 RepID=A0AA96RJ45_9BACL|nr:right-handed parallel beta-helix repeat-containing protein [Paenibacillus sp. MBLB1832]WNR43490.1 right-handed parallel beta-helix repeat-containing protein [Paenibacillus sp. MBLB1832]